MRVGKNKFPRVNRLATKVSVTAAGSTKFEVALTSPLTDSSQKDRVSRNITTANWPPLKKLAAGTQPGE
ncbi:MAG: hypothetical protein NVS1B11_02250 [Terriglobales bacterium]